MFSTIKIAIRFTLITAVLLGLVYPLAMTVLAHFIWRDKSDGQLITRNGQVIGSAIIGQSFTSDAILPQPALSSGQWLRCGQLQRLQLRAVEQEAR